MTIKKLRTLKATNLLNIKGVCEASNLDTDRIYRKIHKRQPLEAYEARALDKTLRELARQITKVRTFEDLKREKIRKVNQNHEANQLPVR